jgi:hypothetical protein
MYQETAILIVTTVHNSTLTVQFYNYYFLIVIPFLTPIFTLVLILILNIIFVIIIIAGKFRITGVLDFVHRPDF